MYNKSLSLLLKEHNYNCELVSKMSRIPLYTVKNTAIKLQVLEGNSSIIVPPIYIDRYSPQLMRLEDKFNFGKHKGNSLSNVIKHDSQYLRWLLSNNLILLDESV